MKLNLTILILALMIIIGSVYFIAQDWNHDDSSKPPGLHGPIGTTP